MESKIITEEDFWECSGGLMPAPFQSGQQIVYTNGKKAIKYITKGDKSTLSWVDFSCKKLMLLYAIAAAIAAAIACLCAATGGAALIAICAVAGAVGAAWGAVIGSLICGHMVAMAREWITSKDDFQILGIHTIAGKDKMVCNAFTFIGMSPETITYKPNVKSWSQALSLGAANLIGEIFKGMMAGACIGAAAAAIYGIATAAVSGGWAGVGKAVLGFIKSAPTNFIVNLAESISGIGLAMRGVMTAQSGLATYGELGEDMTQEDLNNAMTQGFFAMEIGTYESGKNIVTGNGTAEDYAGLALNFTPAGKGLRDIIPHNSKYQRMGIVPESFANKMDFDSGKKGGVPDADSGKQTTTDVDGTKKQDDGFTVKKQGGNNKKAKGKDGNAYEKVKVRLAKMKIRPPFKIKDKFKKTKAKFDEYKKQLTGQERGLNKLTVEEYLNNRDAYLQNGRSKEGTKAQREYRDNYRNEKVDKYMDEGLNYEEALAKANKEMEGKAALHDPDQVAGGHGENVTGLGDSDVNSSIGSQWDKNRANNLDADIRRQAENMTPEERANTYLDIELEYE